jgi:hypothetical protein
MNGIRMNATTAKDSAVLHITSNALSTSYTSAADKRYQRRLYPVTS